MSAVESGLSSISDANTESPGETLDGISLRAAAIRCSRQVSAAFSLVLILLLYPNDLLIAKQVLLPLFRFSCNLRKMANIRG
jgi:hypothetical protein